MDSNRSKSRSFSKSKLVMSFYRAVKPSSAPPQPYSSKLPKPSPANSLQSSFEFAAGQPIKPKVPPSSAAVGSPVSLIIVNQEQVFPQQTPTVAFVVADRNHDSYGKLENFYGAVVDDEGVDAKAAEYISRIQETFQLERVNSERKNLEDINL